MAFLLCMWSSVSVRCHSGLYTWHPRSPAGPESRQKSTDHELFPSLLFPCCWHACLLSSAAYGNVPLPFPCSLFLLHLFALTWAPVAAGKTLVGCGDCDHNRFRLLASALQSLGPPTYLRINWQAIRERTTKMSPSTELGKAAKHWMVSLQSLSTAGRGLIWRWSLGKGDRVRMRSSGWVFPQHD